jgi:uncharacterized protein YbjT (DUF2867 family)
VDKGGVTFGAVHEQGARTVALEAVVAGLARLVHVSGIGADPESRSPHIRARGRGELLVQQAFPREHRASERHVRSRRCAVEHASRHRPVLPVLPMIGRGRNHLQPIYVEDVAEAIAHILADPSAAGRI